MKGAAAARVVRMLWAVLALLSLAAPASAIEFFDGKIKLHGFYETRLSYGWEDFSFDNDIDMYGFLHVLNMEADLDLAPDGWGPFDMVGGFVRVEVKFDCVYVRGCYLLPNTTMWGERAQEAPERLQNAHRNGLAANQIIRDTRAYTWDDLRRGTIYTNPNTGAKTTISRASGGVFSDFPNRNGRNFVGANFGNQNFALSTASPGPDGIALSPDDAGYLVHGRWRDCLLGTYKTKLSNRVGAGAQDALIMHSCEFNERGELRNVFNPFNSRDTVDFVTTDPRFPVAAIPRGPRLVLPFRPSTELGVHQDGPSYLSQGLFLPNMVVREMQRNREFDDTDQFFTVNELQWNRGASQQSEKELREAYLEFEMFDSRLWVRAGKQTIVWGKTELFRNQDQFNPVDIAIGPLASLEESRIALWALRGIWSFYEVGPLEDVRLELVGIYDDFEPSDLGICGEPFVPRAVCLKGYGLWAHANTGAGVAGEIRPPDPWNSWKGIEGGARLEFRWDRFSFALTDYYGFTDTPYTQMLFQYSRNVDPVTGRPREGESEGRCVTGNESACLTPSEAIEKHSVNQQIFHWICASTVGVAPTVDPTACAQTLFNSKNFAQPGLGLEFATLFSTILSGRPFAANQGFVGLAGYSASTAPQQNAIVLAALARESAVGAIPTPLVNLNNGGAAIEGLPNTYPGTTDGLTLAFNNLANISTRLTDWQEALLGCGPFYQTGCDRDGLDLMNSEASAMVQSFAWFEGTEKRRRRWDTTLDSVAQPGTVGFAAGAICTRHNRQTGQNEILPGCRGPGDPGYDPAVDGSPTGLFHPFTGQQFRSEMAAVSWNFQMLAASLGASPDTPSWSTFDPNRPFRKNGCSWRMPQFCSFISGIAGLTRITSPSVRAAGNGEYGRRHWVWSGVGTLALQYEKRNIVGFSMDFAEDTTKSSWGVEYTYSEGMPFTDNGDYDGISFHGVHQLTISVDRPTFINFLNNNRTFFINSQLFIGYTENFQRRMTVEGPWNFLWLVTANTGYFQDRMLAGITLVWDFQSNSGAFLPNVQYRFTENFSATVGAAFLTGKYSPKPMGINQFVASSDTQQGDRIWVENGISPARDLDNFFFRLRYTF